MNQGTEAKMVARRLVRLKRAKKEGDPEGCGAARGGGARQADVLRILRLAL